MVTQNKPTERYVIVVGIDGTDASTLVIETASRIARSIAGAELHLVNVVDDFSPPPDARLTQPKTNSQLLEAGRARLQQAGAATATSFAGRIMGHLATGTPWREIVQCAERVTADLVIVGSHNLTGIKRLALGSVSEHVVRKAKCPVLVVRKTDYQASDVPEIEPACPDCLTKQRETNGETLWCDRHGKHHPLAHLHYERPQTFGIGSGLLRPEG